MSEDVKSTLELHFYALYDTKDCVYVAPFVSAKQSVLDDIKLVVNDVKSSYYGKEKYYILYDLGIYNNKNGTVSNKQPVEVCHLDSLIDENIRNVQVCIQTLNYLPKGYFKAPKEMQEEIQARIDDAIKFYTKEFIEKPLVQTNNSGAMS